MATNIILHASASIGGRNLVTTVFQNLWNHLRTSHKEAVRPRTVTIRIRIRIIISWKHIQQRNSIKTNKTLLPLKHVLDQEFSPSKNSWYSQLQLLKPSLQDSEKEITHCKHNANRSSIFLSLQKFFTTWWHHPPPHLVSSKRAENIPPLKP